MLDCPPNPHADDAAVIANSLFALRFRHAEAEKQAGDVEASVDVTCAVPGSSSKLALLAVSCSSLTRFSRLGNATAYSTFLNASELRPRAFSSSDGRCLPRLPQNGEATRNTARSRIGSPIEVPAFVCFTANTLCSAVNRDFLMVHFSPNTDQVLARSCSF